MFFYAIDPQRIYTNQDIGYGLSLISRTFETFGPRELVVINEYTQKVEGCFTQQGLKKADERGKFYVKDARQHKKNIQTVSSTFLKKEKELRKKLDEIADKERSLFLLRKGTNPKKLYFGKIVFETPLKCIKETLSGTEYEEDNCPYTYKLKVGE